MARLVRRPSAIYFEPLNKDVLSTSHRARAKSGTENERIWLAYAAHLDEAVPVTRVEMEILADLSKGRDIDIDSLYKRYEKPIIDRILEVKLLDVCLSGNRESKPPWEPLAHLFHIQSRWGDSNHCNTVFDTSKTVTISGDESAALLVHRGYTQAVLGSLELNDHKLSSFDELLSQRKTCWKFNPYEAISLSELSLVLKRSFGFTSTEKKPSDFKLGFRSDLSHGAQCYVVASRVVDLQSAIYFYCGLSHQLVLLREIPEEFIRILLAGQHNLEDAAVHLIMTTRFERLFCTCSSQPKALKLSYLEAGHLSQLIYLSAAELGLGVFVTVSFNDKSIEKVLNLDPLKEGVTAVLGVGAYSFA